MRRALAATEPSPHHAHMYLRRVLQTQVVRARKLAGVIGVPSYRRALQRWRVVAAVEHAGVPFREALTVIDVGANRGQFALFARHCFPAARIEAFEPLPEAATTLAALFYDDAAFRLHRMALDEGAGERTFHITRADDSSSLRPPTAIQTGEFPGTDEVARITVTTQRLDATLAAAEIARPCLLKIDVQGGELEVLSGAEGLLAAVDQVYVECSYVELYAGQALAPAVIAQLATHGLHLIGTYHAVRGADGVMLQADLLFDR